MPFYSEHTNLRNNLLTANYFMLFFEKATEKPWKKLIKEYSEHGIIIIQRQRIYSVG